MDNLNENERETADAAEAEKDIAATDLGKFKDVKTLLKAYSDLEAEFTRRSQRLKQLEQENKTATSPDGEGESSSQKNEERIKEALGDNAVRDAVISDYLKNLAQKSVPLAACGEAVAAPRNTPKTVKQAGKLAQQFLNG